MNGRGVLTGAVALVAAATLVAGAVAGSEASSAGGGYKKVGQWGKDGTGNGQFTTAAGLAVDRGGNVYVADGDNNRVQVFSSTGRFLRKWGTVGDGNGQFHRVEDVAVASDGTVWVADYGGGRVQQFKADGTFLTALDVSGFKEGPAGIAVGANGDVLIAVIGEATGGIRRFEKTPTGYQNKGLIGSGQLRSEDSEVSPDGTIYQLTDESAGADPRIRRYTADGKALGSFAPAGGGGFGFGIDLDCNVWVLDAPNRQNVKYSPSGKRLATAVSPDLVALDSAVGPRGDLYVLQNSPQSVLHFVEDTAKPATASIPTRLTAAGRVVKIAYALTGVACPAVVGATATLTGPGIAGRAAGLKLKAGARNTIVMRLSRAASGKATFKIVLQTNGRPTTETRSVTVVSK